MIIPFPEYFEALRGESIKVLGPYYVTKPEHQAIILALIAYLIVNPERDDTWSALERFLAPEFVEKMRERWDLFTSDVGEAANEPA